ncbi:hypothetical protein G6F47_012646 [Rhizopus delemar]|nr:hypothetical protein G6F53_012761 [Rhizopus delemar]KAG1580412.1 hypothetical protein G6F47_012646 [Rhizopus delemar]KAG1625594.1 hypothetical protein G6F44_012637 [Rhizopus delemar]
MSYTNYGVNYQDEFNNNFQLNGWNKSGEYDHNSGTYSVSIPPRRNYGCDNINILTSTNSTLVMGLQCPATGDNSTRFLQGTPKYTDPKSEYNDLKDNGIQTNEDKVILIPVMH